MFEWVCPKCDRSVLAELKECPYCGAPEAPAAAPAARPAVARPALHRLVQGPTPAPGFHRGARKGFNWADVERGFRFGLGFLAALALGYFLLFGAAWVWDHAEWMSRLTRLLRFR
jgi:hypothetical protein